MPEIKDIYRVSGRSIEALISELNRILQRLSDRLDQIEGRRGTPQFYSTAIKFPNGNLTAGQALVAVNDTDMEVSNIGIGSTIQGWNARLADLSNAIQLIDIADVNGEIIHKFPLEWMMYNADVFMVVGDEINAGSIDDFQIRSATLDDLSRQYSLADIYDGNGTLIHQYPLEWMMYASETFRIMSDDLNLSL